MKTLPLLLLILISGSVVAQQAPIAGFSNPVILRDENGFPGHIYFNIQASPEGKIYSQTYNGDIFVSGNNYYKRLDSLSRLQGGVGRFIFHASGQHWFFNSRNIALLDSDSVTRVIQLPQTIENGYSVGKTGLYYFKTIGNNTEIYVFDGSTLSLKKIIPDFQITTKNSFVQDPNTGLWRFENKNGKLELFQFDTQTLSFIPKASYPFPEPVIIRSISNENSFLATTIVDGFTYVIRSGKPYRLPYEHSCGVPGKICIDWESFPLITRQTENGITELLSSRTTGDCIIFQVKPKDIITKFTAYENTGRYLGFTNNKPLWIIPYLKIFPAVLNNTGADIFALTEDSTGRIWAGSYKGGIAILKNNKVLKTTGKGNSYLNGSLSQNGYQYFIREYPAGGLIQYSEDLKERKLTSELGFYIYADRKKDYLYYGTAGYKGIWRARLADLETGKTEWEKLDSTRGVLLNNIITITEDRLGRIWAGHPRRGISVYSPETGEARTWLTEKNESPFGAYASVLAPDGSVWFGTNTNGLWYYNDYSKPAAPSSCKKIIHPLLASGKPITGLALYKSWLLIAATDKVLLLNLDSFRIREKVIIRYLNPGEHDFTGVSEQNSILLSKKDSSVWFSNSDMLYQWDIRQWLSLPVYNAKTEVRLVSGNSEKALDLSGISLAPEVNSFEIEVHYFSPDHLPRYISSGLIRQGDSVLLSAPSLKSTFSIQNIAQGRYTFVLDIYETDGQIRRLLFPIQIRKYLWQHWWFWLLTGSITLGCILFLFNQKRKRDLAEARLHQQQAELISYKSLQEKKISQLQLATLVNQFRPHFILNALNTIGAQMDDKPEAETVLSRLGESVNIIFNHAQNQKILHQFESEWTLVLNIISIHRIMYLKQLQVELPPPELLKKLNHTLIPLGILQIPVENALLHGLNNKESAPWILSLNVEVSDTILTVTITDNGIGRNKSAHLSNFTKHGTGTRNINEIITILNQRLDTKIVIQYEDEPIPVGDARTGTRVIIEIPLNLNNAYE